MKSKKIKIPIYFGDLVIIIFDKWDEINKKYDEINKKYDFDLGNETAAISFNRTKKSGLSQFIVCLNKKCDTSIIVHETVHLVNYIFRERGLILDLQDDEAQAYLTGWVFNSINKYYSKNK